MADGDWRVEVELDDEAHGYSLGERLRALDLDDEARERLGGRVIVSRDRSRLFLYAASAEQAQEAEGVIREELAKDDLTAEISTSRWHPVEQAWEEASIPLPASSEEIAEERQRRDEAERREAELSDSWDWHVRVEVPHRDDASKLADRVSAEGRRVHRRWRYVTIDTATEEEAIALADRLREEAPAGSEISVELNAELVDPVFVLLSSRTPL